MRWVALLLAVAACTPGGLAPPDARPAVDGAPAADGSLFDASLFDASLFDASLFDASLFDASLFDAEPHDAEPALDAEPAPDAHDPLVPSLTMVQFGFAGSYTLSPPGTSCGPGCFQYATPTDVTVTLTLVPGANLSWGVGPCVSQAHNPQCTVHVEGELVQEVDFFCPTFVVDVVNGNDANVGTCGAPFKTIGRATSVAHDFQIIRVLPGTYSDATETFPIRMPAITPLWGDELTRGAGVVITTVEPVAVLCGLNSNIAGLTITATTGTAISAPEGCSIHDNTITGSVTGIDVAATSRIENNVIRGNTVGVAITGAGVDLGTSAQRGRNELACNGVADLTIGPALTATAVWCAWDHDPPSGADLALGSGATVDVSNSTVSETPCP